MEIWKFGGWGKTPLALSVLAVEAPDFTILSGQIRLD